MKDIPVLTVTGKTLAEAYENAIYQVFTKGCEIKTQYDKAGFPPSKDCTLNLTITDPGSDPMIHKAFPGGIADLREYVMELHGAKDEWVKNMNDSKDTRWEYTYHGRLTRYGAYKKIVSFRDEQQEVVKQSLWTRGLMTEEIGINQVEYVINKLVAQPYTRQAQMITWMPSLDLTCYDPPCLQSIWLRIIENGDDWILNTNIRFRSNDAWSASFFNMFGFIQFIKTIADQIAVKANKKVMLGRVNWLADSYHIYGKDIENCKKMLIDKIESGQPFDKRVYNFNDPDIQLMYGECVPDILKKIEETEKNFAK